MKSNEPQENVDWSPQPGAGDIVWCHFPNELELHAKARPGLVLKVAIDDDGFCFVTIAYGTSQKLTKLFAGEFAIRKNESAAAYEAAGLSYDTKFNLKAVLELPFNTTYFTVPPHAPYGHNPKLGFLHPSYVRIAAAAYAA